MYYQFCNEGVSNLFRVMNGCESVDNQNKNIDACKYGLNLDI